MNEKRRNKLRQAILILGEAETAIDIVRDQEEDSLNNIPENLQYSDRYESMEKAVDAMNDAIEHISNAIDCIDDVVSA